MASYIVMQNLFIHYTFIYIVNCATAMIVSETKDAAEGERLPNVWGPGWEP